MKFRHALALVLALGLAGLSSAHADSLTVDLIYQLSDGTTGDYGEVTVNEVGGDLHFTISRGPDLGPSADLVEFYFNLAGAFTGLAISSTDPQPGSSYLFGMPATERGEAMFSFDAEVNFGDGSGAGGNGTVTMATFTLSADQALTLAAIMETSSDEAVPVEILFGAFFRTTGDIAEEVQIVGAPVPLPAAAWLFGSALLGFPAIRRWSGRRSEARGRKSI
jgi:hypothetical protein